MTVTRIPTDVNITGSLSVGGALAIPAGSIVDASVAAGAAIDSDKLQHLHKVGTDFGIAADAAPAADVEKIIFIATAACTIRSFKAVLIDTGTTSDVKFDLQKAATTSTSFATVLSATVDFVHGDADNTVKTGTLSAASLVAGDVLQVQMDYTSATGVLGPYAFIELDETPS